MSSCVSLSPAVSKAPITTSCSIKKKAHNASKMFLLDELHRRHDSYLKKVKRDRDQKLRSNAELQGIGKKSTILNAFITDHRQQLSSYTTTTVRLNNCCSKKRPITSPAPNGSDTKRQYNPSALKITSITSSTTTSPYCTRSTLPFVLQQSPMGTVTPSWLQRKYRLHRNAQKHGKSSTVPGTMTQDSCAHRSDKQSIISVSTTGLANFDQQGPKCKRRLSFIMDSGQGTASTKCEYNKGNIHVHGDVTRWLTSYNGKRHKKYESTSNLKNVESQVKMSAEEIDEQDRQRLLLKATQRSQIYALNAVMRELEQAKYLEKSIQQQ